MSIYLCMSLPTEILQHNFGVASVSELFWFAASCDITDPIRAELFRLPISVSTQLHTRCVCCSSEVEQCEVTAAIWKRCPQAWEERRELSDSAPKMWRLWAEIMSGHCCAYLGCPVASVSASCWRQLLLTAEAYAGRLFVFVRILKWVFCVIGPSVTSWACDFLRS